MDAHAEQTLQNLHVLSAVSQNDKLMTNEETFAIYVPTTVRGAIRMWYGEGRQHNVQRIRQTLRSAMSFVSKTLEDANGLLDQDDVSGTMRMRAHTVALQHKRMLDALWRSKTGLVNLRFTYREDAAFTSQIQLAEEEIDTHEITTRPHTIALMTRCAEGSVVAGHMPPMPSAPPPSWPS